VKPVDLNFAGAPFRNNSPYYLGYGIGAFLVVLFTVYNAWAYVSYSRSALHLEDAYAANRAKLETLRKESADLQSKIEKVDLGTLNGRAAFTNGLLERRRFSWTDLLNSLEEAQVYQVRLLSLLPRIQEKGILIDARAVAHDLKAMWNFQQNLQIHPKFRRVYPGGWTKSTEENEIVFNLAFNYFPQGAPEGAQGLTPQEAGLQDFVEAPGPSDEGGPGAQGEVPETPAPGAPPSPKKPPVSTVSKPAPAPPSPTVSQGRAPGTPPPSARLTSPDAKREAAKNTVPGSPADGPTAAAPKGAAPVMRAPGAGVVGAAAYGQGGAGSQFGQPGPTGAAGATGATGVSGATGASGNKPPRRVGRGPQPGSRGERPPPPAEPDVPTVPPAGSSGGNPGDTQ